MTALSTPKPQTVTVSGTTGEFLAFYYPGNNTDWDNHYGVPYFGNFWISPFTVQLKGPLKATFHTAEAAYQASKWWDDPAKVKSFENAKTGKDAFDLKKKYDAGHGHPSSYGGYKTGEEAMKQILIAKFSDASLKKALGATGDAYLLEHGAQRKNQDMVWSDGNDGTGTNHLGLSLMEVRDHYFSGKGNPFATEDPAKVVMECTTALRAEMKKLGLSADSRKATR
ncbi:MAG: NADAR family protein [Cyclobacteriaceae bacterium]